MAHFNECSNLVENIDEAQNAYDEAVSKGKDPLQIMLDMQKSLQVRLANDKPNIATHPDNIKTAGQAVAWMREQKDCIDDEFRELLTSFGEMHRGDKDASAVWKKWKSRYEEAQAKKLCDMSESDLLEIKMELCDITHFVLNMYICLGMDSEEIFKLYFLKNQENFNRQDNGY